MHGFMHKVPPSQADSLRVKPPVHTVNTRDAALIAATNASSRRQATSPAVPSKGHGALLAASLARKRPSTASSNPPALNSSQGVQGRIDRGTDSVVSRKRSLPPPVPKTDAARSNAGTLTGRSETVLHRFEDAGAAAKAATASSAPGDYKDSDPRRRALPSPHRIGPPSVDGDQRQGGLANTTFEIPIVTLHQASPRQRHPSNEMDSGQGGTDETPIAPTTSLVELFEKSNNGAQGRTSTSGTKSKPHEQTPSRQAAAVPKSRISPRLEAMRHRQEYDEAVAVEAAAAAHEHRGRPPVQGQPALQRSSSAAGASPTPASSLMLKGKPVLPPPRRGASKPIPPPVNEPMKWGASQSSTPPRAQPIHIRKSSSNLSLPEAFSRSSLSPNPNHYQQRSIRQISPHITGDSLANAIVGASLASRQTSPHRAGTPSSLPPLPARNVKHQHQHHSHNPLQHFRARSSSPMKPNEANGPQRVSLRATLRREESSSSDEGRGKQGKGRKHRFRKHPNKHHEGDRKRWRDTITERERRRYEGLWAANKGLYTAEGKPKGAQRSTASSSNDMAEEVLDLVVREIWSRSRLPPHVLAEVWDLVDHRGQHRLTREEFVVGTWLVDQCLKGRKVPSRVMDSVWMSVKLLGVKVRKKNFQ